MCILEKQSNLNYRQFQIIRFYHTRYDLVLGLTMHYQGSFLNLP